MSPLNLTHILTQAVDELSESESYKGLFHRHTDGNPLPSAKVLRNIIEPAQAILSPGYFGNSTVNSRTATCRIGCHIRVTEYVPAKSRKAAILHRLPDNGLWHVKYQTLTNAL